MRSPHQLHGVLDVTPFPGLFRLALALAGLCILRRLGDRTKTMLFDHLSRDGVDLRLGCHFALPDGFARMGTAATRFRGDIAALPRTVEAELSFHAVSGSRKPHTLSTLPPCFGQT